MSTRECAIHKLVADVCLVAEGHVLLVRYKETSKYDSQTGWFLPDDYLKYGEHPDDAAVRILQEQVGQIDAIPTLSHIESFDSKSWHIIFHYQTNLERMSPVKAQGNVKDAKWFSLKDLPPQEDVSHHGWGLDVIERVLASKS
jgi:ADP-ribose pyrophosphatase YjhB (NUDIX family)